jgi:hypothetical protein
MKRLFMLLLSLSIVSVGCNVKINMGPDAGKPGKDGGLPAITGDDPAENAAEEALKANGGLTTRDWNAPGKPVIEVFIHHEKGTDGDIKHLLAFKQLKKVNCFCKKVTGAGMKELAALPKLEVLNLAGSGIGDAGVKEIVTLKGLKALSICSTHVSDAGLHEIAAGLPQLEDLNICQIREWTDAGIIEAVAKMKNLRILSIGNTDIGDKGFAALAALPKLEELHMIGTKVTEKGSLAIGRFPALRKLRIGMHQITDATAREIAKIKTLKELDLFNTMVSGEGRKAIQDALPGIKFKS